MAAPNLHAPTTITGKTAVQAVGTSPTAIVSNASSSGLLKRVRSLVVGNVTSGSITLTVDIYRSSTAYRIVKETTVPPNSTIIPISRENTIDLEEGDDLRLTASSGSSLEAIASFDQIG